MGRDMEWAAWAEILGAVLAVLLTGVGTVLWFLFLSVRNEAREARAQATLARDSSLAEITKVKDELGAHRLYVAEHYVTQNELTKAVENLDKTMQRMLTAMDHNAQEMRDGFTQLHKRIDGKADKS